MDPPRGFDDHLDDRNSQKYEDQQEPHPKNDDSVVNRGRGCRRRSHRKKRKCVCTHTERRKRRLHLSTNPFLIFYLELYFKNPNRHVTEVARQAGKKWCSMPQAKKERYIKIAEKMKRRCSKKR